MSDAELADVLIERLNRPMAEIPAAGDFLYRLMRTTVLVESRAALEHPTLQVWACEGDTVCIGWIGLLNGIVGGINEGPRKGWGYIAAVSEDGVVSKFARTDEMTDSTNEEAGDA